MDPVSFVIAIERGLGIPLWIKLIAMDLPRALHFTSQLLSSVMGTIKGDDVRLVGRCMDVFSLRTKSGKSKKPSVTRNH